MWLATQHGFYSIVQKDHDLYFIRARVRKDLENLKALAQLDREVLEWPEADYRYRVKVDFEDLLEVFGATVRRAGLPELQGARSTSARTRPTSSAATTGFGRMMADLQG